MSPASLRLVLVDAFAVRPFTGNQAAVAVLGTWPPDALMGAVAAELGWSETAFVVPVGDGTWGLRWFTPTVEVDLCGHATLAAACVLGGQARFTTRSGVIDCWVEDPAGGVAGPWVGMALPADRPVEQPVPDALAAAGVPDPQWFGRGRFDVVAVLADAHQVRTLVPDLAAVASLGARCLVVTAPGDRPGVDMVSRVFGPAVGVPEDPVTGSAHSLLAELWGPRVGRPTLVGEQASQRGGIVRMRRLGSHVVVSGQALVVGTIDLTIP